MATRKLSHLSITSTSAQSPSR